MSKVFRFLFWVSQTIIFEYDPNLVFSGWDAMSQSGRLGLGTYQGDAPFEIIERILRLWGVDRAERRNMRQEISTTIDNARWDGRHVFSELRRELAVPYIRAVRLPITLQTVHLFHVMRTYVRKLRKLVMDSLSMRMQRI